MHSESPCRIAVIALTAVMFAGCELIPDPFQIVEPIQTPPLGTAQADSFWTICGWPAGTPLAFQGWATWAELGIPDPSGVSGPDALVFAVVSRDPVQHQANLGPPRIGRGICWTDVATVGRAGVPDDWAPSRP